MMHHTLKEKYKRIGWTLFIGFFAFMQVAIGAAVPQQVAAQTIDPVASTQRPIFHALRTVQLESLEARRVAYSEALELRRDVKLEFGEALLASALGGLLHTASYFVNRIAYDTAVWIAAGGKGQASLIFKDGFGDYLRKTAADAAVSGIVEFGEDAIGLNLCSIPDYNIQVFLQIGLRGIYDPDGFAGPNGPQPNCTFQEFKGGWSNEAFEERFGTEARRNIARSFSDSLKVSNSDFGIALGFFGKIDRLVAENRTSNILERLEGEGIQAVKGLVNNKIQTPAALVKKNLEVLSATQQQAITSEQIAGVYGAGFKAIIPAATQLFANTLTTQLLNRAIEGLFGEDEKARRGGQNNAQDFDFFRSGRNQGLTNAQNAFGSLFAASPVSIPTYDIITEFAACSPQAEVNGPNNCVIDPGFQRTLLEAKSGTPLTIAEAIEKTWLHGEWPLISPRRTTDNTSQNCYLDGYCFSNIQKLRKVGILPIGFEIAALNSDPDNPWTLAEVVNGFDKCDYDPETGAFRGENPNFPFCHLINPNWVVKAPEARCESEAYLNTQLSENVADRARGCIDISTCTHKDSEGNCLDYGYCTKSKNVWSLTGPGAGDGCPAEYATCQVYTNSRTGNDVAYLARSVDYDQCGPNSVGCLAYSTEQINGDWLDSTQVAQTVGWKRFGRNSTVYFNDRLISSGQCDQSQEGCSGFYVAVETEDGYQKENNDPIFLKKAPAHLGCYDVDRSFDSPEVNYPSTLAQIENNLPEDSRCENYARVCIEEEVNCELYEPLNGGVAVPGIIGANACPERCVGYDTFKQVGHEQQGQGFEDEAFPLYFIPTDGEQCSAAYVGCDEFTNIDERTSGGENLEQYTSVKYCEKPDGNNEQTYYTWEGSVQEGYVLKTHKLLQVDQEAFTYMNSIDLRDAENNAINVGANFPVGSPAYADDSKATLELNNELCNERNYQNLINNAGEDKADPDCRAFYDNNANPYYRLLRDTVSVSDSCHPLRKTVNDFTIDEAITTQGLCEQKKGFWNGDSCQRCTNGGQYENGACIYWAITAESQVCPAAAMGCREYRGNIGNNVFDVFGLGGEGFEPTGEGDDALANARANWTPENGIRVVAESAQVGLHSLQVDTNEVRRTVDGERLETEAWYKLSFWARGAQQNMSIFFRQNGNVVGVFTEDIITRDPIQTTIGTNWREYQLGPVQFTGATDAPVEVVFVRSEVNGQPIQGPYYIDNVNLVEIQGNEFLIKDSWKDVDGNDVPTVCDSTPDDAFPGEMLGCAAYTYDNGQQIAQAVGFETLCRAEAVGCTALIDTFNTLSTERATAYNIWCANPNEEGTCELFGNQCEVEPGQDGCFIDKVTIGSYGELPSFAVVTSTIFIPEDTEESNPIFLVDSEEHRCENSALGCQQLGLEKKVLNIDEGVYEFENIYIKNNPDQYVGENSILCRDDLIGCGRFEGSNSTEYFKDPEITGASLCYYKEANSGNSQDVFNLFGDNEQYGWFMEGVGNCSTAPEQLCRSNSDCPAIGDEGGVCEGIGNVPCYDEFLLRGGEYGLWSNESPNYKGFVGECEPQYDTCTELIDPQDTSQLHPEGQPYYVLFNDKITSRITDQVSLERGHILFDKTDEPNKRYDSVATYEKSAQTEPIRYDLVAPESTDNNDTNVIIKVDRDRECSEWLACKSHTTIFDKTNTPIKVCHQYQACNESAEDGRCINWADPTEEPETNKRMTQAFYVNRDTDWKSIDYTGYSLVNKFPVTGYTYLNFFEDGNTRPDVQYLGYRADETNINDDTLKCSTGGNIKPDWTPCGDTGGRCVSGICTYPIDAKFAPSITEDKSFDVRVKQHFEFGVCKEFPEADAPFETSRATNDIDESNIKQVNEETKRTVFGNEAMNLCQDGECSCEYERVEYISGEVDYWSLVSDSRRTIPRGVCSDGSLKEGYPCIQDADCGASTAEDALEGNFSYGVCNPVKSQQKNIGKRGFCLEFDFSRPIDSDEGLYECLTWYPSDISASNIDIYNADVRAGYDPSIDAIGSNGIAYGQAYCLNSTGVGRRQFINDMIFINDDFVPEGSMTGRFSYRYKPHHPVCGYPGCYNVLNSNDDCSDAELIPIKQAVCHSSSSLENRRTKERMTYTALLGWMWEEIGSNTAILRFDNYRPGDQAGVLRSGQNYTQLGFAPDEFLCRSYPSDTCTAMHPPRTWEEGDDARPRNTNNLYLLRHEGNERTLNTALLSPEEHLSGPFSQNAGTYIWRAPYESDIREGDLQKVYFVPLAYADGAGAVDRNPLLWSTYLNIDLDKLSPDRPDAVKSLSQSNVPITDNQPRDDANNHTFEGKADQGSSSVYSYVLTREDIEQLRAFGDYEYDSTKSPLKVDRRSAQVLTGFKDLRRNEIHRRYVAMWGTTGMAPYVGLADANAAPGNDLDPFTRSCDRSTDNESWVAIGMDFNADGEFLGYISRWCHGTNYREDGDTHWMRDSNGVLFGTVAKFNDHCTDFVQVYDDQANPLYDTTNKAWTDRVWANAEKINHVFRDNFTRNIAQQPYGSLPIVGSDVNGLNKHFLRGLIFSDVERSGLPYNCGAFWLGDRPGQSGEGNNQELFRPFSLEEDKCKALLDAGYSETLLEQISKSSPSLGRTIGSLFAKSFNRYQYSPIQETEREDAGYDYSEITNPQLSIHDIGFAHLTVPQVYSLNPITCFGERGGERCTAGEENNITIGTRNGSLSDFNGDGVPDEDRDRNGRADPIIAIGTYEAYARFFGWADSNRMPIRSVKVDWQDASPVVNSSRKGLYKNRKPACISSGTLGRCLEVIDADVQTVAYPELACATDADCGPEGYNQLPLTEFGGKMECVKRLNTERTNEFGNATRACTEEYFEFVHTYACSNYELNNPDVRKNRIGSLPEETRNQFFALGYSEDDRVCTYKPRVQVLDNWGWCNGFCDGVDSPQGTCFNDDEEQDCDNPETGVPLRADYPWTPYNGVIYVAPQREGSINLNILRGDGEGNLFP